MRKTAHWSTPRSFSSHPRLVTEMQGKWHAPSSYLNKPTRSENNFSQVEVKFRDLHQHSQLIFKIQSGIESLEGSHYSKASQCSMTLLHRSDNMIPELYDNILW